MVVLAIDAAVLLGSVVDAEIHALVFTFRNRDAGRYLRRFLLGVHGLDVDELEQLHLIELALGVLDHAAAVEVAWLEIELPQDHAIADRRVARNLDRAEIGQRSRCRRERQSDLLRRRPGLFVRGDTGIGMAVVSELVDGHLVRGDDERAVARLAGLDRKPRLETVQAIGGNVFEPGEVDRGDENRIAFRDADGDRDLVLRVVELYVEPGDARVRIAAIGVERLDPLQVGIESSAVEVVLAAPGKLRALACRERAAQARLFNGLDAAELEFLDLD